MEKFPAQLLTKNVRLMLYPTWLSSLLTPKTHHLIHSNLLQVRREWGGYPLLGFLRSNWREQGSPTSPSKFRSSPKFRSPDRPNSQILDDDADNEQEADGDEEDNDDFGDEFDEFEEGQEAGDDEFGDFDEGFGAEGVDGGASSQPPVSESSRAPIVSVFIVSIFECGVSWLG
jgi:hypothetical protein